MVPTHFDTRTSAQLGRESTSASWEEPSSWRISLTVPSSYDAIQASIRCSTSRGRNVSACSTPMATRGCSSRKAWNASDEIRSALPGHGANGLEPLVRDEKSHLAEEVSRSQSVEPPSYFDLRFTLEHHEHPVGCVAPLEDRLVRLERHLISQLEDGVEVFAGRFSEQPALAQDSPLTWFGHPPTPPEA
jgi:hypothetical protein